MSETNNPRPTSHGTMAPSPRPQTLMTKTGSPADGKSKQGITIGFVLAALRQWWKVAVPLGLLLGGSGAGLVYKLVPWKYEASAWLQIREAQPYIALPPREQPSKQTVDTQLELIKSPMVLRPVLNTKLADVLDLQEDTKKLIKMGLGPKVNMKTARIGDLPDLEKQTFPIQWLAEKIQVRQRRRSEYYLITFSSTDKSSVALVVNEVVRSYFDLRRQQEAEQIEDVREPLEAERKRQADNVERLRKQVQDLAKKTSGNNSPLGGTNPDAYLLADLKNRLITAELEQQVLSDQAAVLEELAAGKPLEVPLTMVDAAVQERDEVQQLESVLAAKQAKLQQIKTASALEDKAPAYKQLAEEVKSDRATLGRIRAELRQQITNKIREGTIKKRGEDQAALKASLNRYRIQEEHLRKRYEKELKKVKENSEETMALEFKQAELQRAGTLLDLIAERDLRLYDKNQAPSRVTSPWRAEVPTAPVELFPWKFMTLALLAGLCLPIALAVMWELAVQRVGDAQQLEEHSNITIVGETPRLPVRARMSRGSASRRAARNLEAFEESIDGVRTCLMLSEPLRSMKVLAVTSAVKNEGKTSVASQLAVSIAAASGQPTLLVDGDMRSPDIHNLFEVPIGPGLADVLAGKCLCEDAIVTDWGQNVHLLPAGKLYTSPHKLLGNGALKSLLETVRRSYDYVVIDTPPILAASEALVLAKAADATLVCAMQDISRLDQVCKGHHRLLAAGARSAGTVLNGVSRRQYAYRYGSYSYADV